MAVLSLSACASGAKMVSVSDPLNPSQEGVLVGVTEVEGMVIQLELEPSKAMWMLMSMNGMDTWTEMPVAVGALYHVEVKLIDPGSADRISFAEVKFKATNKGNGQVTEAVLHPMWGGSGLHYAFNSGLSGDGTYEAVVTVEPPIFARSMSDSSKWMTVIRDGEVITISALFRFKLSDGKLVEISAPEVSPVPTPKPFAAHADPTLPVDPSQNGVLIGEATIDGMVIDLELEPAKAMLMFMNMPEMDMWMVMTVAPGELYHVEVKTIDPKSNTRVPYAEVSFKAVNQDSGTITEGTLHPMWGGSGLHYAFNSGLSGDGTYEITVTVEPPAFARSMDDKDKWMQPIVAYYHFKMVDGKVVEGEVHDH